MSFYLIWSKLTVSYTRTTKNKLSLLICTKMMRHQMFIRTFNMKWFISLSWQILSDLTLFHVRSDFLPARLFFKIIKSLWDIFSASTSSSRLPSLNWINRKCPLRDLQWWQVNCRILVGRTFFYHLWSTYLEICT